MGGDCRGHCRPFTKDLNASSAIPNSAALIRIHVHTCAVHPLSHESSSQCESSPASLSCSAFCLLPALLSCNLAHVVPSLI